MEKEQKETIGVRYTGWAALNRDPLEDLVEFTCPQCGTQGTKALQRCLSLQEIRAKLLERCV